MPRNFSALKDAKNILENISIACLAEKSTILNKYKRTSISVSFLKKNSLIYKKLNDNNSPFLQIKIF